MSTWIVSRLLLLGAFVSYARMRIAGVSHQDAHARVAQVLAEALARKRRKAPPAVLCSLNADLLARLATGEEVQRAVWIDDRTVISVRITANEDRPLVLVGAQWCVAEFAERVGAVINDRGR